MKSHMPFKRLLPLCAVVLATLMLGACAQTRVVDTWTADEGNFERPDKVAVIAV